MNISDLYISAVHFKHTSVHSIQNLDKISLGGIKLKFKITCRTMKQKSVIPIGSGVFNFQKLESCPTLTCTDTIPVNFDNSVPIVLGSLRVTVQMGYGKLYYGNEFIGKLITVLIIIRLICQMHIHQKLLSSKKVINITFRKKRTHFEKHHLMLSLTETYS